MNRAAFHAISYGLYIVSSVHGRRMNGQIANTVFQVTGEPPMFAVSINKLNLTHDYILKSHAFAISVLAQEAPMEFVCRFGFTCGRDVNKFEAVQYKVGKTGVPIILDHCVAFIEVEVLKEMDCGTHRIFLGSVKDCDILRDGEPMTYAYYRAVKGGQVPKFAPTFLPAGSKYKEDTVERYTCSICGYVYDPEKGDPDAGVQPGTSFADLPDDWVCPICGADKSNFTAE